MPYSAHLSQTNEPAHLICMSLAFCVITIVFVVLRFYVRRLTRAGLDTDDWLALSASVGLLPIYSYPSCLHMFADLTWKGPCACAERSLHQWHRTRCNHWSFTRGGRLACQNEPGAFGREVQICISDDREACFRIDKSIDPLPLETHVRSRQALCYILLGHDWHICRLVYLVLLCNNFPVRHKLGMELGAPVFFLNQVHQHPQHARRLYGNGCLYRFHYHGYACAYHLETADANAEEGRSDKHLHGGTLMSFNPLPPPTLILGD